MEILQTNINGLLVIKPKIFYDDRGSFFESFNEKTFAERTGTNVKFVQDNQSLSKINVLRGLHFQSPPYAQGKLVRVIKGKALDVVVDIRKNSPTYAKHFSIELSGENNTMLWIPAGFAHGFSVMEEDTIFVYKCTDYYNKDSERTLMWNDPELGIDWKIKSPIVSAKDQEGLNLVNLNSPF